MNQRAENTGDGGTVSNLPREAAGQQLLETLQHLHRDGQLPSDLVSILLGEQPIDEASDFDPDRVPQRAIKYLFDEVVREIQLGRREHLGATIRTLMQEVGVALEGALSIVHERKGKALAAKKGERKGLDRFLGVAKPDEVRLTDQLSSLGTILEMVRGARKSLLAALLESFVNYREEVPDDVQCALDLIRKLKQLTGALEALRKQQYGFREIVDTESVLEELFALLYSDLFKKNSNQDLQDDGERIINALKSSLTVLLKAVEEPDSAKTSEVTRAQVVCERSIPGVQEIIERLSATVFQNQRRSLGNFLDQGELEQPAVH